MTIESLHSGRRAPVDHHFVPVSTYSSPSRSMRVEMLVASLLATAGSVIEKHDRISPASSGSSHCALCSGVANIDSNSMLPVSGALQFIASGRDRDRAARQFGDRGVVEHRQAGPAL